MPSTTNERKLCKNCNSELVGQYCSECGQKNIESFTFSKLVKDFFDNIFSLDSRLFQTLKFLIIRPGFLTNEYWSGKRITYLPPFRLYLLTSILFFFIPHPDYQYGSEEFFPLLQRGFFVLMPCMALILLILYRKNNLLYFHHFITTLHFHSFMFLMFTINNILLYFYNKQIPIVNNIVTIIIIIYLFFMLKNIYIESLTKLVIKFALYICIYAALLLSTIIIIGTYMKQS
jgi:hypothetical protein